MIAATLHQLLYALLFFAFVLGAFFFPFDRTWSLIIAGIVYLTLSFVGTYVIDRFFDPPSNKQ